MDEVDLMVDSGFLDKWQARFISLLIHIHRYYLQDKEITCSIMERISSWLKEIKILTMSKLNGITVYYLAIVWKCKCGGEERIAGEDSDLDGLLRIHKLQHHGDQLPLVSWHIHQTPAAKIENLFD